MFLVNKSYVLFFTFSIDASREDDSLGRLVNDDHKYPNCKMKQLAVQDKPHLCLFAIDNIQAESEITYDYGESMWPWRALTPSVETMSQPPTDQETPSVETMSQTPTDQEVSEKSEEKL
nr:histone-lysine N-methyltransferase set-1-like isoform X1 [Nothobranchius furzeri]